MTPARRGVFQLASHLGMTVKQLQENMTVGELIEWAKFFQEQNEEPQVDLATAAPDTMRALFNGNG